MPKLIVSATNDQFFATDALNLYWNDLKGSKWILYLPNANHVSAYSDPRVNSTAFAFVRAIASNKPLPQFTWEYRQTKECVILTITTGNTALKARIWQTTSKTRDFRQSQWIPKLMQQTGTFHADQGNDQSTKVFEIELQKPLKGYMAVVGEITFLQDGHTFLLSTQTHINESK